MRTTDPTPQPFRPLGERVKPVPTLPAEPIARPTGTPGVVEGADGRLRTNLPLPKG